MRHRHAIWLISIAIICLGCSTDDNETGASQALDASRSASNDVAENSSDISNSPSDSDEGAPDADKPRADTPGEDTVIPPKQGVETGLDDLKVLVLQPDKVSPGLTYIGVSLGESPQKAVGKRPSYLGINAQGVATWSYVDETAKGNNNRMIKAWPQNRLLASFKNEYRVITPNGDSVISFKGGPQAGGQLHHDAEPLPNGNVLALSFETQTIDVPFSDVQEKVRGDRVVEVTPGGESVWTWSTFDHIDTTRFPGGQPCPFNDQDVHPVCAASPLEL